MIDPLYLRCAPVRSSNIYSTGAPTIWSLVAQRSASVSKEKEDQTHHVQETEADSQEPSAAPRAAPTPISIPAVERPVVAQESAEKRPRHFATPPPSPPPPENRSATKRPADDDDEMVVVTGSVDHLPVSKMLQVSQQAEEQPVAADEAVQAAPSEVDVLAEGIRGEIHKALELKSVLQELRPPSLGKVTLEELSADLHALSQALGVLQSMTAALEQNMPEESQAPTHGLRRYHSSKGSMRSSINVHVIREDEPSPTPYRRLPRHQTVPPTESPMYSADFERSREGSIAAKPGSSFRRASISTLSENIPELIGGAA